MLFAGGKRGLPSLEKMLDEYKPRMVTIECGIYDIEDGYRPVHTTLLRAGIPIAEHLTGNICRCGTYPRILAAVKQAALAMRKKS